MKNYLIFDCYQTLIYKSDLAESLQVFIRENLNQTISLRYINQALAIIYQRHKFSHPTFTTEQSPQSYYKKYNKELLAILGLTISDNSALALNKKLSRGKYEIYSDTLPILKYFESKHQVPLGLISNWTKTLAEILRDLNLRQYFDFVYSSQDLQIDKPDPRIFTLALRNIRKTYKKIYYVGDDYELDIIPSRQAGFIPVFIYLPPPFSKKKYFFFI